MILISGKRLENVSIHVTTLFSKLKILEKEKWFIRFRVETNQNLLKAL